MARSTLMILSLLLAACQVGPSIRTYEALEDVGRAEIYSIQPGVAGESSIQVAVENTTDGPLRLSDMEWTILDGEGFARATVRTDSDIEIPPRAKEKVTFTVATNAADVATIRLWGQDLDERARARSAAVAPVQRAAR